MPAWAYWAITAVLYTGTAAAAYRYLRQPVDMTPKSYRCNTPGCLTQHPMEDWPIGPIIERAPVVFSAVWAALWPLLIIVVLLGMLGD